MKGKPNLDYMLQDFLRYELSGDAKYNKQIRNAVKKRLVYRIKDYCLKYNENVNIEEKAEEAMNRFLDNSNKPRTNRGYNSNLLFQMLGKRRKGK